MIFRRFGFMPEKLQCDIRYNGFFSTKLYNYKIRLYNSIGLTIENQIFWKGETGIQEQFSLKLWTVLSRESKVILDIGANTGIFSVLAGVSNRAAQIHAFEPSHRVYLKLKKNIELNNANIDCHEIAVSNKDGETNFYDFDSIHQYSASLSNELYKNEYTQVITVKTVTLDSFINEGKLKQLDLLKIDVELHELEVLEGFKNYLNIFKPAIFIEILSDDMGYKLQQLFNNTDYDFFDIDEQKGLIPMREIKKAKLYNYFFCTSIYFESHRLGQYLC